MKIEYNWSNDLTKQQGDSKMNTDPLLFTEDSQKKKPAGDHVHDLCKKYMAKHPEVDYESAVKAILSYPGNEKLAKTYGISPLTMI